jgi:uncharacterized protein YgiM (DUF1202 family)
MKPLARQFFTVLGLLLIVGAVFAVPVFAGEQAQQATFQSPILVVNTSFLNVRTGPGAEYSVLVTVVGGTELPVLGLARDRVWYQVATDGGPGWVNVTFTLPRGEFSNVPFVEPDSVVATDAQPSTTTSTTVVSGQQVQGITLVGANIRTQPDFNALIVNSTVPVDPNTVYPLLGRTQGVDGVEWYLVDIPGVGTGWTDRVGFRLLECGTDQVGVITTQTAVRFDGIAIRDSFDLAALTEGYLHGYAGTDRVRFQLFDGSIGLVSVNDVARRSGVTSVCTGVSVASLGQGGGGAVEDSMSNTPALAANRVIVNTGNLNLRSGPAAGFSVVATVPGGTELVVLGRATDNVWYLVEGDFGQGWLNSQFVIFRGNYSTVPVIRDVVVTETVASAGQGGGGVASSVVSGRQVTGVSLVGKDVHQQPDYASLILSRNTPNDPSVIYPLLGTQTVNGGVWYLVNVPGTGPGWMDAVQLRVLECGTDQVGIITTQTTIRFDGIASRDPFLLDLNTEGYIVGRNGDFVLFELLDGSVGLVNANDVARRTGVTSVCEGVSAPVSAAAPNTETTSSNMAQQPSVTGNRVVINTGNLNVRSGPAAGFSVVATVPGGTQLAVVGRAPDGVWYYVEGSFGRGWLNSEFVIFRGDYGSVPVVNISGS